ncbi:MAG: YceI family protein [Alphaproteobacteria bacterium]|nr:YceI family protein [Alphaproteobacteria bacterium]
MKKLILPFLVVMTFSGAVAAKEWQVDPTVSKLTFVGDQSGERFAGGFKQFTAKIDLDPAHPETGKIDVTVNTATAYAGSGDRDAMLPQSDWFNIAKFPQAQFTSTSIRKTGANAYEADATVTIKGITQKVTLPFTLVPEGDHWRAQGHVMLKRSDYGLGMDSFGNENYVKFPVDVAVDIVAKPPVP